jgi:general secretion pathway protein G
MRAGPIGHDRPMCDPTALLAGSSVIATTLRRVKTREGSSMWRSRIFIGLELLRRAMSWRSPRRAMPQGFTLLEMLVVLVIIGLLAGLVGPRLLDRLDASKVTTTEVQVRNLRTALETLRLDIGRYPTSEEGLGLLSIAPTDPDLQARWRGPYLEDALPNDPWGHPFNYSYLGTGNPPYSLYSFGAAGKPSTDGAVKGIGVLPPES